MSTHRYGPRFSKRATLGALAGITIGVFGIGMTLPYVVGQDQSTEVSQTTETTVRRRQPVPVAQVVETTTTAPSG